jgi:hypothetical protein
MREHIFSWLLGITLACLILVSLAGCIKESPNDTTITGGKENLSTNSGTDSDDFAFYLIEVASQEEAYAAQDTSLAELKLKDQPLLTLDDIAYYDSSTYCIYLKKTTAIFDKNTAVSFADPFVVVARGERCYLGYLLSGFSSFLPHGPFIRFPSVLAADVIHIDNMRVAGAVDLRNDTRIHDILAQAGKLDLGLNVTLTDAKIVNRTDDTTMSYSFTVANLSDDALYVPDSDKMGTDYFHYFTNGLVLNDVNDQYISMGASLRSHIVPDIFGKLDIDWFIKLAPGESISRTVLLSGYPEIAAGTYRCQFKYSGPGMISKKDRKRPDGRIWIGEIASGSIEITVTN